MQVDEFRQIEGYPGYFVSRDGRVGSIHRTKTFKILNPQKTWCGYRIISYKKNGKGTSVGVHVLVALAFLKNPDNKPIINHLDGNKENNHLSNLQWCTYSENKLHSHRILGNQVGESHHRRKLDDKKVIKIRKLYEKGKTKTELSKMFGVMASTIKQVVNRETWRHI